VELVRDGVATATPERTMVGGEAMYVKLVQITEAGRQALDA
jgi:hypothetical protein